MLLFLLYIVIITLARIFQLLPNVRHYAFYMLPFLIFTRILWDNVIGIFVVVIVWRILFFLVQYELFLTVLSHGGACQLRRLVKERDCDPTWPVSLSRDLESFLFIEWVLLRGYDLVGLFISSRYLDPYCHSAFYLSEPSFQHFLWFSKFSITLEYFYPRLEQAEYFYIFICLIVQMKSLSII